MADVTDITFEQIVTMIESFSQDANCSRLKEKYRKSSLFEIAKVARSERVHSFFLAWLFRENFENIPLNGLLNIIYHNHITQIKKDNSNSADEISYSSHIFERQRGFIDSLRSQAIIQNSKYRISNVWSEYPIPSLSGKNNNKTSQYIDILIECSSTDNEKFYIVVENKVSAAETLIEVSKEKENDIIRLGGKSLIISRKQYKLCGQTLAYFHYFNNEWFDKNLIYLFLDPSSSLDMESASCLPTCACKGFIHITYQDIMDKVLIPLKESPNIDDRSKNLINEYVDCLGTTLKRTETGSQKISKENLKAMALDKESKELIQEFWNEHEALIMAVLDALSDDNNTDKETRDKIKNAVSAIRAGSRNTDRYSFIYNNHTHGSFKKNALLYEIVKVLSPSKCSDLIDEFVKILDHNKKPGIISKNTYLKSITKL